MFRSDCCTKLLPPTCLAHKPFNKQSLITVPWQPGLSCTRSSPCSCYSSHPTTAVACDMQAGNCLLPGVLGRMRCPKCRPESASRPPRCPANTTAGTLCPSLQSLPCTLEVLSALAPCPVLLQDLAALQPGFSASGLIFTSSVALSHPAPPEQLLTPMLASHLTPVWIYQGAAISLLALSRHTLGLHLSVHSVYACWRLRPGLGHA